RWPLLFRCSFVRPGFYSVLKVSASVKPAEMSCGLGGFSDRTSRPSQRKRPASRLPLFLSPHWLVASRLPNLDVLNRLMLRAVPEAPSAQVRIVCPREGGAARNQGFRRCGRCGSKVKILFRVSHKGGRAGSILAGKRPAPKWSSGLFGFDE